MSKRNSAGGWTGLILAALCLAVVAYIFHASSAHGSSEIYFVDTAISANAR